jgi:hypothetical protein
MKTKTQTCCSVPVPTEQKDLLKVLTCLYEQYVHNQTPATDDYFTNPTQAKYAAMKAELDAITVLINVYLDSNKTFVDSSGNNVARVDLWDAVAQGMVHYNSALADAVNNFPNAIANNLNVNDVISNVGVLKTVQKLNLDECADKAYQVTPVTNGNSREGYTNNTQASLVERVGCPGVSNLGFLGMTLQVPIANAPFNNCYVAKC